MNPTTLLRNYDGKKSNIVLRNLKNNNSLESYEINHLDLNNKEYYLVPESEKRGELPEDDQAILDRK